MKILKLFLVNLIFILLIIFAAEMYSVKFIWHEGLPMDKPAVETYLNAVFNSMPVEKYYEKLYNNPPVEGTFCPAFRPDLNVNSDKGSIVFMGCSFTYGDNIPENETVSYQMAKLTGRPVYNRACRGWGPAHWLYMVRDDNFYKQFPKEPEYIIFVTIYDHINRLDKHKIIPLGKELQPKYKMKNNHLVQIKPKPWDYLFVFQQYQYHKNMIHLHLTNKEMKLYFTEIESAIRKHWKNTKLVIFEYCGMGEFYPAFEELRKEKNYTLIRLEDLSDIDVSDNKYRIDGWHPTGEVWRIVLPPLIKELDIK